MTEAVETSPQFTELTLAQRFRSQLRRRFGGGERPLATLDCGCHSSAILGGRSPMHPHDNPQPLPALPIQYRQGDVFLLCVPELPAGALRVARRNAKIVLALGEATGHAHVMDGTDRRAHLYEHNQERFLVVAQATRLVHEEHAAIPVAPGVYRVRIQREYVAPDVPDQRFPRGAASRRVVD